MKSKKSNLELQLDQIFVAENQISPKKWAIVAEATKLFVKRGYMQTGLRDIAEACCINPGTLYYYFKSKDEILGLILDRALAAFSVARREQPAVLEKVTPEQTLKDSLAFMIKSIDEQKELVAFWYTESHNFNPEIRDKIRNYSVQIVDIFEQIIVKGCETGIFKVTDTRLAAINVVMLMEMWALRRYEFDNHYTSKSYLKLQVEMILRSLGYCT
ncbi:MAG: TetR/AcrR family transcriptional regulator [Chloroflexi bacterium]|nr:TetR/AcrR family transcriptional regulator [Chloroflexota bacterium]